MGLIQTQTFGLMKPSPRITARNAHLVPEIYHRAKRILQSAAEECVMSNSVVRKLAELWSKYKTGTKCSCSQLKEVYDEECDCKRGVPDIATFLKSGNLRTQDVKEFCPICFGSGIEGGYNLYGTVSVVLTANNPSLKLTGNMSIKKGSPYTILCGTKGKATWDVLLPKYYLNTHTIVLYWNKIPYSYSLYLNDEPFNLDIFNTLGQIQKNNNKKVKITVEVEDESGTVELYYLRFMLKINRNTLVSVDVPNYTYSYTGELSVHSEVQSNITVNFDSTAGKIETTDIIAFEKDGIAYRIVENEFNAPMNVIISNNCQARLIRSHENYLLLPSKVMAQTYPMDNYTYIF